MRTNSVVARGSFKIDIYETIVYITVVKEPSDVAPKAKQVLKKNGMDQDVVIDDECHGYTVCIDTGKLAGHIILSKNDITVSNITHETDHLKNYILDFKMIKEDENKEASANLNGYINQKLFDFLIKKDLLKLCNGRHLEDSPQPTQ